MFDCLDRPWMRFSTMHLSRRTIIGCAGSENGQCSPQSGSKLVVLLESHDSELDASILAILADVDGSWPNHFIEAEIGFEIAPIVAQDAFVVGCSRLC